MKASQEIALGECNVSFTLADFCRERANFLSPTKNRLVWGRSRLGIQPLFGDEPVFSPKKTAGRVRLGSCHWGQQPNVYFHIEAFSWRRFMQSCIKSGRFYEMKKYYLEAWSCQRCFLDIVEACVQILKKYEGLFTKERQEPSGHADAFTLSHWHVCLFTVPEARNITASFHVVVQRALHHLN